MQSFIHNCKGAVTVFVTLLLIPAILITGTGVDLTRLYVARSVVQNANQLAANSALASYDTLLKDLYGLFAIMKSDDELAEMLDAYIRASLYGEDVTDAQLGEFRLFWGTEGYTLEARGLDNLSNIEVLRRQIEEYAKWRAPVAIINNILNLIDGGFGNLKEDAEAIEDKIEIDELYEEVVDLYMEIFMRLKYNDHYGKTDNRMHTIVDAKGVSHTIYVYDQGRGKTIEERMYDEINALLDNINSSFNDMNSARDRWYSAIDEAEAAVHLVGFINDQNRIRGYANSIINLTNQYKHKEWTNFWFWQPNVKYYEDLTGHCLESYKHNFEELLRLSVIADDKASELRTKITELREKLNECTDKLQLGMEESLVEYESIIENPLNPMIEGLRPNLYYINNNVLRTINELVYGTISASTNKPNGDRISLTQLRNLNLNIDDRGNDILDFAVELNYIDYYYTPFSYMDSTNKTMLKFADLGNNQNNVYIRMKVMFGNAESSGKVKKRSIDNAVNDMLSHLKTGFSNDIKGAKKIPATMAPLLPSNNTSYGAPINSDFGTDNTSNAKKQRKNSQNGMGEVKDLLIGLGTLISEATNKVLLLSYGTEMFSCYITGEGDNADNNIITMAGYAMGTEINYLYQSELEYIFAGKSSANSNLNTVTGLIYLVRFVFNYISTFRVDFVRNTLNLIQIKMAAFVVTAPFATVTKELVRVIWTLVETGSDVCELRNGYSVALFKCNRSWLMGPNILSKLAETLDSEISTGTGGNKSDKCSCCLHIYYSHYLTIFLVFVNGNTMANRISDLIALNMTNKYGDVNADEDAMSGKVLFPMNEANTTFELTTTTHVRFMFLSLNYAQGDGWINARPPKTFPIHQTYYRGY